MKVINTELDGLKLLEPTVYEDSRGFFLESYNSRKFNELLGLDCSFVQDNHSQSNKGVLRGLHYQLNNPQGKLVRVVRGEIFDVAVDIRKDSDTFGQWFGVLLSAQNKQQLWVPKGFAHGFLVVSDEAEVLYKTSDFYVPGDEHSILWDDCDIGIQWPQLDVDLILSDKDRAGKAFKQATLL